MVKRALTKFSLRLLIRVVNGFSTILADDPISIRIRKAALRLLNCRLGAGSIIMGGGYINGRDVRIGAGVFINRGCYFDLNNSVTIGDRVYVANHVRFITTNHEIGDHYQRAGKIVSAPVTIEDGAWIGANVVLLPGVRVGAGSVVAGGAVVSCNVEPDTLVGGVPARIIRRL